MSGGKTLRGAPLGPPAVLSIGELRAACTELGAREPGAHRLPPFNPLSLLPVFEVEPGREGPTDGHGGRARVCHGADVSASRPRLSGEWLYAARGLSLGPAQGSSFHSHSRSPVGVFF